MCLLYSCRFHLPPLSFVIALRLRFISICSELTTTQFKMLSTKAHSGALLH
jgi:hypothetical protein